MLHPGLVSITFRKLSPTEIITLAAQAEIVAIEWGGDVHVPHGHIGQARIVGAMTSDNGLTVSSYGTYYRVGHPELVRTDAGKPVSFEAIVETAAELGAPKIRVWAGNQGTDVADQRYIDVVAQDSQHIANLAHAAGLQIAYEYHGNTLTDSDDAATRLLETVRSAIIHPGSVQSFWQPRRQGTLADGLAGIEAMEPYLADIHVFSWHKETAERLPLAARANDWSQWLQRLNQIPGDRFALLEFVQDDEPNNFLRDAKVLKEWLKD